MSWGVCWGALCMGMCNKVGEGLQCPEFLLEAPKLLVGQEVSEALPPPAPSSLSVPFPLIPLPLLFPFSPSSSFLFSPPQFLSFLLHLLPLQPLPSAPSFLLYLNSPSTSSLSLHPLPESLFSFPPHYFFLLHPPLPLSPPSSPQCSPSL